MRLPRAQAGRSPAGSSISAFPVRCGPGSVRVPAEAGVPSRTRHDRPRTPGRGGSHLVRVGVGRAQRGALRVPVGDRRSKPYVLPPPLSSGPRGESSCPRGVGTCAARSAARAGRRPAFQAVRVASAFELRAEGESSCPRGVGTCAARSAARAGRRPAFQAWGSPPPLSSGARRESFCPGRVGTCAARSAARAGRRPAFQAVRAVGLVWLFTAVGVRGYRIPEDRTWGARRRASPCDRRFSSRPEDDSHA